MTKKLEACPNCGKAGKRCKCRPSEKAMAKATVAEEPIAAPTEEQVDAPAEATPPAPVGAHFKIVNGVYTIGDVSFGIDPESITNTRVMVGKLPEPTHDLIVTLHGETIEDKTRERIATLATSFVQQDWYMHFKGDVPMAVKKNHATRVSKSKGTKAAAANGNGKVKGPRGKAVRLSAKCDLEKFGGKAKDVLSLLAKMGSATTSEVRAAFVKKTGDAKDSKVAEWVIWKAKKDGLVVGA